MPTTNKQTNKKIFYQILLQLFALTALILTVLFLPETLTRQTLTAKEKAIKKINRT